MSTDDPWATPPPGQQPRQPSYGQAPAYGRAPAYGTAPQYGAAPSGPPARPSTVRYAVLLMYVGAALSLLAALVTVTTQDQLRAELERQTQLQGGGQEVPPGFVDGIFGVVVVVSVVLAVVAAGLWIMNAVACSAGRNWGRITGTVLGGLYVLSALASLLQPTVGAALAVTLLTVAVAVAAIVLLWLRPSNEFFAAAGAARRAGR